MSGQSSTAIDKFDSVQGDNGSNVTSIKMVGYDHPLFLAFAVVLSLFSFLYCFKVDHEEAQRVYFQNREEAFIEQLAFQGYKVPPDLLKHIQQKDK